MPSGTETSRPPVLTKRDELLYRLRQQSLLGEFARSALQTRDMRQIVQRATELCAQGLEAPFAKVLEYIPDEKRLLIRAGVGWPAGTIDHVSLGADVESPAGYAFHTGKIVISNHLQEETRFRTPQLLAHHGIRPAINLLIPPAGQADLPTHVTQQRSARPPPRIRTEPPRGGGPPTAPAPHTQIERQKNAPQGPAPPTNSHGTSPRPLMPKQAKGL